MAAAGGKKPGKGKPAPDELAARRQIAQAWTESGAQRVTGGGVKPLPLPVRPAKGPAGDPARAIPNEAVQAGSGAVELDDDEGSRVRERARAAAASGKSDQPTPYEELVSDRRNLLAAGAWTLVAFVWATTISFVRGTSSDIATDSGPGPFPVAFVSIAIAWTISILSRLLGRYWYAWYVIPLVLMLVGPPLYRGYWATGVRSSTAAYLSATAADAEIDIDVGSATSATINTPEGCFDIVRRLAGKREATVTVITHEATTARRQADLALTPKFAKTIPPGGDAAVARTFVFTGGRPVPVVSVARKVDIACGR